MNHTTTPLGVSHTTGRISGTLHLRKPGAHTPTAADGKHVDLTRAAADGELAMPNERDEKVGVTDGIPSAMVQQGARDLKRGIQDTSKSVESDVAYAKLKDF